ncbi:MAG TPA: glycosyltransferase, partial [Alphaproteobacteria bacterium]|nr:glycosyltransferase [Alphaproteobacteria bacterium]
SLLHRAAWRARNAAVRRLKDMPRQTLFAAPPPFLDMVRRTAAETGADLVIANYWHLWELAGTTGAAAEALLTHDVDFRVQEERARRGLPSFPAAEARRRERIEREAYRRFDRIVTVTPRDAETITALDESGGKIVTTMPHAIDLERFRPAGETRRGDTILMLGSFDADFNRDALRFFAGEVLPLVRERRPGARLSVVGHHADDTLRREAGEAVDFAGGVPDIGPHLAGCAVMVLPLRFGGGVRIRMMEAAAAATPVVSTPVGVAGMDLERGTSYLEAADARGMADAVLALLDDPALAGRIGAAARRWAEGALSMENYPDRLERLLERLLDSSSNRQM